MRLIMVCLFVASIGLPKVVAGQAGRWFGIDSTADRSIVNAIDLNTVVIKDSTVTAWIRRDYKKRQLTASKEPYNQSMNQYTFNCKTHSMAMNSYLLRLNGKVVTGDNDPAPTWSPIVPDSEGEAYYTTACFLLNVKL